jgi:archaemetzincin
MRRIDLLPVGEIAEHVLEALRDDLARALRLECRIIPFPLAPDFALHAERGQFHSSEILVRMRQHYQQVMKNNSSGDPPWRLLGVTSFDLYIPILTFVFGEAEVGGCCAIVSSHRLDQRFYGLPPDPALERSRLLKEAIHELGHTLHLTHCEDYRCAMSPSHAVEWIDLKDSEFCSACRNRIFALHSL